MACRAVTRAEIKVLAPENSRGQGATASTTQSVTFSKYCIVCYTQGTVINWLFQHQNKLSKIITFLQATFKTC